MIGKGKECFVCGTKNNLHRHHIFFGTANRKNSEKYSDSCTCYLCWEHHEGQNGVHGANGHLLDLMLKEVAQTKFEETHTREEFIEIFGRNYL